MVLLLSPRPENHVDYDASVQCGWHPILAEIVSSRVGTRHMRPQLQTLPCNGDLACVQQRGAPTWIW